MVHPQRVAPARSQARRFAKDQSPLKFWRRARQQIKSKWQRGIAARRLPRGLRRHPRRSVSPARSRQSSTDRTALPHRAESSACLALTDFLSLSRTNGEPSVYNRGYAASREQAMRYFKARYIGPSEAGGAYWGCRFPYGGPHFLWGSRPREPLCRPPS